MLTHLSIKNIVLIEKAELSPKAGLCVLSGETGAGKSILLDALGLVLGGRAEAKLVRAGEDKATISASFNVKNNAELTNILDELGFELEDDELVIRRQLMSDGKSKAYINDSPISAKALKSVGETLLEIHGQHTQRGLLDEAMHGTLLDAYGELGSTLAKLKSVYINWRDSKKELSELETKIEQAAKDRDYLEHMRRELGELNPQKGEEETLTDERTRMMQFEKMAGVLDDALSELSQPKDVHESLRKAQSTLSRSTLKATDIFEPAIEALERAMIEVGEARNVLEELGRESGYDQYELERTEERLFALKAAGRKYNLPVDELAQLHSEVDEKLTALEGQEHQLGTLSKKVAETKEAYLIEADKLHDKRTKTATKLEKALHAELAPLKMEATRFKVVLEDKPESSWNDRGKDAIRFEVATNKGANFGALNAIASGGELSRFMLALAVVLAEIEKIPTMIFDEIDTGTGGAVADAIGSRLQKLGEHLQVLVVTHLPQVAARGNQHLFISKDDINNKTTTTLKELNSTERHEELARMISGAEITTEARNAAQKLLENAA